MTGRETDRSSRPEIRLRQNASLPEMEGYFGELYGPRDSIYLPGRDIRIQLLDRGIDDLQIAVRKGAWQPIYGIMCARVVSRILCVARGADDVSVSQGLEMKYPQEGCAYCGQLPCACQEKRPDHQLGETGGEQQNWSLRQWQEHLANLYGPNNAKRGILDTLLRLTSENSELISLEHSIFSKKLPIEEAKLEYSLELADATAWTMASATLLGVDVQSAVEERYGRGCLACVSYPCACTDHNFDQVRAEDYGHIMEAPLHN